MSDDLLVLEPRSSYDQCIVGAGERFNDRFVVYDRECVLQAIIDDMDDDEEDPRLSAEEHFSFNILSGWVGDATPAFVTIGPIE